MKGNCEGHKDPDMWFPELPPNRPSVKGTIALAERINEAISLCKSCPIKVECGIQGSKPKNLPHGIWGGMLAGERLLELGVDRNSFNNFAPETSAIDLFNRVSPWLER